MVQTQASAAGTLSAIIFILPGLLMLGYWQGFPFWQTLLLCACGGSLGVLFTISPAPGYGRQQRPALSGRPGGC